MLRHRGLRDVELRLDDRAQRAGRLFSVGEQLEDPPPYRIAENVERVHRPTISAPTYISQRFVKWALRSDMRVRSSDIAGYRANHERHVHQAGRPSLSDDRRP